MVRSALLGLSAACVSDCLSNGVRVLKTTRQTSPTTVTYAEAAREIVAKEGVAGLLGRGLRTRLVTSGVQASLFTVVWKLLEERIAADGLLG